MHVENKSGIDSVSGCSGCHHVKEEFGKLGSVVEAALPAAPSGEIESKAEKLIGLFSPLTGCFCTRISVIEQKLWSTTRIVIVALVRRTEPVMGAPL